jgi:hypothetical protein
MSSSIKIEPHQLPEPANHNEGKTPAAWATNAGIVVGVIISGIGFMIPAMTLVWVGVGVTAAALIGGAVLRALGYGQPLNK